MASPRGGGPAGAGGSPRRGARRAWWGAVRSRDRAAGGGALPAASRCAVGVPRPARARHRRAAPARSRPNPEPALGSAAGVAPSRTELLDGGRGLGRAGRGSRRAPRRLSGEEGAARRRLGAPGGAGGAAGRRRLRVRMRELSCRLSVGRQLASPGQPPPAAESPAQRPSPGGLQPRAGHPAGGGGGRRPRSASPAAYCGFLDASALCFWGVTGVVAPHIPPAAPGVRRGRRRSAWGVFFFFLPQGSEPWQGDARSPSPFSQNISPRRGIPNSSGHRSSSGRAGPSLGRPRCGPSLGRPGPASGGGVWRCTPPGGGRGKQNTAPAGTRASKAISRRAGERSGGCLTSLPRNVYAEDLKVSDAYSLRAKT